MSALDQAYRHAVRWIAVEDEPEDLDAAGVTGYITVHLVADIFDKDPRTVADAVVRRRKRLGVTAWEGYVS